MKKKDPIEQIQDLYSQLNHKTSWIAKAAEDLGKSPQSLRVHWFAQFWSIPKEYHKRVIELLQKELENQKTLA